MYIFNSRALASELKAGELSQREQAKYLIATLLLILIPAPARVGRPPDWVPPVQMLIAALGTIVGVWICFSANEKGDGRAFLDRFICLGWITAVRVGVAFAAAEFICAHLARFALGDGSPIYESVRTILDRSLGPLFEGIFFWRLWRQIRFVSNTANVE